MGMYTELLIKCNLKKNLPDDVGNVLSFMFSGGPEPTNTPSHKLFETDYWKVIGRCFSYYHHPAPVNSYKEGDLFSRSDFKEGWIIEEFINWLAPYIDEPSGKCIGWSWYEECDEPYLIIMKGK
jgi:hypothetical protein